MWSAASTWELHAPPRHLSWPCQGYCQGSPLWGQVPLLPPPLKEVTKKSILFLCHAFGSGLCTYERRCRTALSHLPSSVIFGSFVFFFYYSFFFRPFSSRWSNGFLIGVCALSWIPPSIRCREQQKQQQQWPGKKHQQDQWNHPYFSIEDVNLYIKFLQQKQTIHAVWVRGSGTQRSVALCLAFEYLNRYWIHIYLNTEHLDRDARCFCSEFEMLRGRYVAEIQILLFKGSGRFVYQG